MNINDYKHPAARHLDEMISGRLSITSVVSKIVDIGPDVWQLVLQRLPKENLRQLARQVYLDLRNDVQLDVLRGALWRQAKRSSIDLPIFLAGCVGNGISSTERMFISLPYVGAPDVDNLAFAHAFVMWTKELERFSLNDSVEEMMLGQSITGKKIQIGDILWFLGQVRPSLLAHCLPVLAGGMTTGHVSGLVKEIVRNWPAEAASRVFDVVEKVFPKHIRSMRTACGENLLLFLRRNEFSQCEDRVEAMFDVLLSYGCDPNEKCRMGYSWNDIRRWEGAKQ